MVSLTAATVKLILNDSAISDTDMEILMDVAVDLLNLYGAEISNMTGAAGTKTVSVESKQKGALMIATRAIYYGFWKGIENVGISSLSVSVSDVLANPAVISSIKDAAARLKEIEVGTG